MAHIVERSPITGQLLTALRTLEFPVGDNSSPTDASGDPVPFGWDQEPNQADTNFTPWLQLTSMPGRIIQTGTLDTFGAAAVWELDYIVFHAGVTRNQSEMLADRSRNLLALMEGTTVAGEVASWNIMGVRCVNLGSSNRVGEGIPYYYTQSDSYVVWVTEGD